MGTEKTQLLTRKSVYWINMNADKEHTVKQCAMCLEYQCMQPHKTVIHYEISFKPWEVVAADIYMVNNKNLLCIVHYYSKFPVVKR